ncbi:unnamed protein product [Choristocarpus tenellus]
MCRKINDVSAADIMAVAQRAVKTVPSLSLIGEDLEGVPTHEQVCGWFGKTPNRNHPHK